MGMATIGTQGPTLANRTDLAVTGGPRGPCRDTFWTQVLTSFAGSTRKRITKSLATTLNVTRCHRKTPQDAESRLAGRLTVTSFHGQDQIGRFRRSERPAEPDREPLPVARGAEKIDASRNVGGQRAKADVGKANP